MEYNLLAFLLCSHTDITNTEIYLRLTMERYDEVINVGHYIYERVLGGGSDD